MHDMPEDLRKKLTLEQRFEMHEFNCQKKFDHIDTTLQSFEQGANKYLAFLDILIEREKEDKEMRLRMKEKLYTGTMWATVGFVCLGLMYWLKETFR